MKPTKTRRPPSKWKAIAKKLSEDFGKLRATTQAEKWQQAALMQRAQLAEARERNVRVLLGQAADELRKQAQETVWIHYEPSAMCGCCPNNATGESTSDLTQVTCPTCLRWALKIRTIEIEKLDLARLANGAEVLKLKAELNCGAPEDDACKRIKLECFFCAACRDQVRVETIKGLRAEIGRLIADIDRLKAGETRLMVQNTTLNAECERLTETCCDLGRKIAAEKNLKEIANNAAKKWQDKIAEALHVKILGEWRPEGAAKMICDMRALGEQFKADRDSLNAANLADRGESGNGGNVAILKKELAQSQAQVAVCAVALRRLKNCLVNGTHNWEIADSALYNAGTGYAALIEFGIRVLEADRDHKACQHKSRGKLSCAERLDTVNYVIKKS